MAPSAHCSVSFPVVYWDVWLRRDGAPAWYLRLYAGDRYHGPRFVCYHLPELLALIGEHDHLYPIALSQNVHPAVGERFTARATAAGLCVFTKW